MNTRDRIEQLEEDVDDLQHQLDVVLARLDALELGAEWIAPEQTDPGILAALDALSGVNAGIDWRAEAEADWEDGMDFPPYPGGADTDDASVWAGG